MKVYVSHAFDDDARFDDLCLALERDRIPFWHPKEIRGGASLRDELREAIKTCDICIFLATQKSLASEWCKAELGAFWGAGKEVIIYVADDSFSDEQIAKQFQGDVFRRKMRDVIADAKTILQEKETKRKKDEIDVARPLGEVRLGTFIELIQVFLGSHDWTASCSDRLDRLAYVLRVRELAEIEDPSAAAILTPQLQRLVGEDLDVIQSYNTGIWKNGFSLTAASGHWMGYACDSGVGSGGDVRFYKNCLLLHSLNGEIDAATIVASIAEIDLQTPTSYQVGKVIARQGSTLPEGITAIGRFTVADNPASPS